MAALTAKSKAKAISTESINPDYHIALRAPRSDLQ